MAYNKTVLQGMIPTTEKLSFELKTDKKGDDYINFFVSVQRNWKPDGEKYYPTDMYKCKAFKGVAKFIGNNFDKGDHIMLEGTFQREEDYEREGSIVKGEYALFVREAYFCGPKAKGEASEAEPEKATAPAAKKGAVPAKPPAARPPVGKRPPNAFAAAQ